MTEIVSVRPKPLPPQDKPWRKAGIHLACIYAVLAIPLVTWANSWSDGMETGRQHLEEIGMAPYSEEAEHNTVVDEATGEATEIGPLDYDLRLQLGQDWMYSYSVDERRHVCEVFQVDPGQVWAMLVQNMGIADTPENRATMDATYQEKCMAFS